MALPKILLVTSELLPEFGLPTAGGGVRAQQLYRSLVEAGFPVELALARQTAEGKDLPEWARRYLYRPEFLDGLVEQAAPDVVLSEGWEPLSHLRMADNRVYVADCPGPLVLENHHRKLGDLRANTHHKVQTLARLDAVLCPNRPMRFYLAGYLTLAGWSPEQTDRIAQVPISFPEPMPPPTPKESDLTVFVGGISWAWHRASPWLLRLADELEKGGFGKLRVRLGKHPHHNLEGTPFEDLDPRLKDHPRVAMEGLTSWDVLVEELRSVHLAVEWSPSHLEREIASTLRIVTCLWCGLPVVVRPHLDLAREVEEYDAGWVVDVWEDLLELLRGLKAHPEWIERKSNNARRLAKERHTWPVGHSELLSFLENATPREKSPSFLAHATDVFRKQEEELERMRAERVHLDEEFERMRGSLEICQQDADAYRSLRQRLPYRIWKKIIG